MPTQDQPISVDRWVLGSNGFSHRCLGLPRGLGGDAVAGVVVVAPQRRARGQHAAGRVEEAAALRAGHLDRNQGGSALGVRPAGSPKASFSVSHVPQAAWSFGQPRLISRLGRAGRSDVPGLYSTWRGHRVHLGAGRLVADDLVEDRWVLRVDHRAGRRGSARAPLAAS